MKYLSFKNKIKSLPVFSTSLLSSITTDDLKTIKVQLAGWKKKGLIVSLRKGLYVLNKEEREVEPSLFYLANQIFIPSYVSLESALAYYGLIPEYVAQITSITTKKTRQFKNEFGIFTYQHLQPNSYIGFNTINESGFNSFIATPEKVIIDFLYLNLSKFKEDDSDIFKKSYRFQNCKKLSKNKIKIYARIFNSKKLIKICDLFIKELINK